MQTLQKIKASDCRCGVVLNPDTSADAVLPYIEICDIVLLMTVQPGFGGQKFRQDVLPKMQLISRWRKERNLNFRIEVDGGIDLKTAPSCIKAGVDTLVAGTSFFRAQCPSSFYKKLCASEQDCRG